MENTCRLIYRSQSTVEIFSNEELADLAATSGKNNEKAGITGMLILSGTQFLQVLEGPSAEVNAVFQRIQGDARHELVELISFEPMDVAYFPDWGMRELDLQNLVGPQREVFLSKYELVEGCVQIPNRLHLVYALLLDARSICLAQD